MTVQVHDYNPGIAPSGLFWTTRIPDDAVSTSANAATIKVQDLPVTDSFVIFGPNQVPATVSYNLAWQATGEVRHLAPSSDDVTDPTRLRATFRDAAATGTFSAQSITMPGGGPFSFHGAVGVAIWAEVGHASNGRFAKVPQTPAISSK